MTRQRGVAVAGATLAVVAGLARPARGAAHDRGGVAVHLGGYYGFAFGWGCGWGPWPPYLPCANGPEGGMAPRFPMVAGFVPSPVDAWIDRGHHGDTGALDGYPSFGQVERAHTAGLDESLYRAFEEKLDLLH